MCEKNADALPGFPFPQHNLVRSDFSEGAQIVYLREMGSGGARTDLEAARRAAAKSIRPQWSAQDFSSWRPKLTKPTVHAAR